MPAQRLVRKDFMWTPDLAYAVGLIVTDGSLSKDGRHVVMTSTDIQLLRTYKACLNKNNKITINPPSILSKKIPYRVQFGDVVFYDWLRKNIFRLKGIKGCFLVGKSKTQKGESFSYRVKFSTKEARILLNWIYYKPDLPCLRRKFKIAKPFLNLT